jgi:hypothetical protein
MSWGVEYLHGDMAAGEAVPGRVHVGVGALADADFLHLVPCMQMLLLLPASSGRHYRRTGSSPPYPYICSIAHGSAIDRYTEQDSRLCVVGKFATLLLPPWHHI